MAVIQKLVCKTCGQDFEFNPTADNKVITSLNESTRPKLDRDVEVTAYLTCPNGHRNPYKVVKKY